MSKLIGTIREAVEKAGLKEVGGQAVLGRQYSFATPWVTERHGDCIFSKKMIYLCL